MKAKALLVAFALGLPIVTQGCASTNPRTEMIRDIPAEYSVTLQHIRKYFEVMEPATHLRYANVYTGEDFVSVQLQTNWGTDLGKVYARISKDGRGVDLDVLPSNAGWVAQDTDVDLIKRDLTVFLMGGRR